jgi:hypothetical protein
MKLRFVMQALQDPPLCSSTVLLQLEYSTVTILSIKLRKNKHVGGGGSTCACVCYKGGGEAGDRRQIRLIEYNVKCRYLEKLTCKGTLRQVFYLSQASSPSMSPYSSLSLHTVYVYTVYSFTQGRGEGGGELTEIRLDGQYCSK